VSANPLTVFFVVAYVWGWGVFIPMAVLHLDLRWTVLATLGPTVAAVIARHVEAGDYRAFRIRGPWFRVIGATVAGVMLIVIAFAVLPAVATADARTLHWSVLASLSFYNYSTLLGGPLFEEPGWRGFALPRLQARLGPVRASILLALVWAGWHAPLFFYSGWTSSPAWIYLLILTGDSLLLTYGTNLARFNVITPIAMHAAFNTVPRFLGGLFTGTAGPRLWFRMELILALGGLLTAALVLLMTRGRLGYRQTDVSEATRDRPLPA
jgi:membrane protease YdiL (CAAX protease family)